MSFTSPVDSHQAKTLLGSDSHSSSIFVRNKSEYGLMPAVSLDGHALGKRVKKARGGELRKKYSKEGLVAKKAYLDSIIQPPRNNLQQQEHNYQNDLTREHAFADHRLIKTNFRPRRPNDNTKYQSFVEAHPGFLNWNGYADHPDRAMIDAYMQHKRAEVNAGAGGNFNNAPVVGSGKLNSIMPPVQTGQPVNQPNLQVAQQVMQPVYQHPAQVVLPQNMLMPNSNLGYRNTNTNPNVNPQGDVHGNKKVKNNSSSDNLAKSSINASNIPGLQLDTQAMINQNKTHNTLANQQNYYGGQGMQFVGRQAPVNPWAPWTQTFQQQPPVQLPREKKYANHLSNIYAHKLNKPKPGGTSGMNDTGIITDNNLLESAKSHIHNNFSDKHIRINREPRGSSANRFADIAKEQVADLINSQKTAHSIIFARPDHIRNIVGTVSNPVNQGILSTRNNQGIYINPSSNHTDAHYIIDTRVDPNQRSGYSTTVHKRASARVGNTASDGIPVQQQAVTVNGGQDTGTRVHALHHYYDTFGDAESRQPVNYTIPDTFI